MVSTLNLLERRRLHDDDKSKSYNHKYQEQTIFVTKTTGLVSPLTHLLILIVRQVVRSIFLLFHFLYFFPFFVLHNPSSH